MKSNNGVTLLELLVSLSVLSLILLFVGINIFNFNNDLTTDSELIDYLQNIMYIGRKNAALNANTVFLSINLYEKYLGLFKVVDDRKKMIKKKYFSQSDISIIAVTKIGEIIRGRNVIIPIFPNGYMEPFTIAYSYKNETHNLDINPFTFKIIKDDKKEEQ